MSERPSPSAAGATTWQLSTSPSVSAGVEENAWKQSLLLANMAGFLGGYFVLYNQWLQLVWGLVMAALWLMAGGHAELAQGLKKDRWMQAVALVGMMLLIRSSVVESPGATLTGLWAGWGNSLLLLGFLLTLWQVAWRPQVMRDLGRPMVAMASVAGVISFAVYHFFGEGAFIGARVHNWLVYGGWNPVNSGVTFAFAACWAAAVWNVEKGPGRWWWLLATVVLQAATLFTLSRGAALVLLAGHGALLLAVGWRRALRPVLLVVGLMALFQTSAPSLSRLAIKEAARVYEIQDERIILKKIRGGAVHANPITAAVDRSDNGRFNIYEAGYRSMTTSRDWLLGKGLWAVDDSWSCSLDWFPEHLHSVFLDTWVHGGLPALLALLGVTAWGVKRAFWLARRGDPIWFMLSCGGLAGLFFDGDSLWVLISVTRYEPLLFWTPLVIASSRFIQKEEAEANVSCRSGI